MSDSVKKITLGLVNQNFSLIKDGKKYFCKKKNYFDPFNHQIKYEILKNFDFVPKLLKNTKEEVINDFIEGSTIEITKNNLKVVVDLMKKIHSFTEDEKFKSIPKVNFFNRIEYYFNFLKEKNIIGNQYDEHFNLTKEFFSNLDTNYFLHNDLKSRHFLVDENNKFFIVDWEYSSYGNIHTELAYFIIHSNLTKEQEKQFLSFYKNYNPETLKKCKFMVYFITILWLKYYNFTFKKNIFVQLFFDKLNDLLIFFKKK